MRTHPTEEFTLSSIAPPRPSFRLTAVGDNDTHTYALPPAGEVLVGRAAECHVSLDDMSVSRRHFILEIGESVGLRDLGSGNGTRVAGVVAGPGVMVRVNPGDIIQAGRMTLVLQVGAVPYRATQLPPPPEPTEDASARTRVETPADTGDVSGLSPALVAHIAHSHLSVLLRGETGVGKEVIAKTLVRHSTRAEKPLLAINCAALSETLLHSELFGHERGAFTGAQNAKPGIFEAADGGTLFLDEVGDLPMSVQVALLRVLESREVMRVGSLKARPVDVRVISATHRNLESMMEDRSFRKDLYFRLNGVTLAIPSLRDRKDKIPALVHELLSAATGKHGSPWALPEITEAAMESLERHSWPGNVRELRNALERAYVLSQGGAIRPEHLGLDGSEPPAHGQANGASDAGETHGPPPQAETHAPYDKERERILKALAACAGNQTRAAKELGISRRTLVNRLSRYDLPRPRK